MGRKRTLKYDRYRPEADINVAGYLTGYIVVQLFTLGRVFVEPDRKGMRAFRKGSRLFGGPTGN